MPKLEADATDAQSFVNYPKDWYEATVKGAFMQPSKATGAPMVVIDWKPDKGDNIGNSAADMSGTIREWVMIGGKSEKGEPINTSRFFDHLDALGVKRDYVCCGTQDSTRPFVVNKDDGKYHCPHCGKVPDKVPFFVNDDQTVPWNGMRARIQVSIRKMPNSDEERNNVGRVVAINKP